MSLDFDAPITVLTFRDKDQWFARLEELNLSGEGSTRDDALEDLRRQVETFRPALDRMNDWSPVSDSDRREAERLVARSARGKGASAASFETTTLSELLD